jgi:hypothetical protein
MLLSNNCLILPTATTSGTYRLDVTGSARVTGTLTTGGLTTTSLSTTNDFSAPNINASSTINLTNNTTTATRFCITKNNVDVFKIGGDGRVSIADTKSNFGATPTAGSLTITADRRGGTASICFPSFNNFTEDYAFIKYQSNYDADDSEQKGRLTIGVENDASEDEIVIASCGGNGKIKLQGNVEITGVLTLSSYINIGAFQSTTSSSTINLAFPLNEYIMVDTTSGTPTFRLPDTTSLSTSVGCAFYIRRIAGTYGISFTSATGSQISNVTNITVASLTGITHLNIKFMLFNKLWYFSSYA